MTKTAMVLKALNQRPVAYYPIYATGTSSMACAVALSQLMHWFSRHKDKIYKTDAELQEETGISDKEMKTVKKKLKTLPFLKITREGVPARTYYEIDWDEYQSSMSQWAKLDGKRVKRKNGADPDCPDGPDCTVPMGQTITESTQRLPENTSPVATEVDDDTPDNFSATMLDAIEVANYLADKLSQSIETYKRPTTAKLNGWAKELDRAIRLDNRTKEQLIKVIDWIHDNPKGSFWIANIQSGKKLREKFDALWFQLQESEPKIPIRQRAVQDFGIGNVFVQFHEKATGRTLKVCIYGEYNALYDYTGNKYLSKEMSEKAWKYIEANYDKLLANRDGGK